MYNLAQVAKKVLRIQQNPYFYKTRSKVMFDSLIILLLILMFSPLLLFSGLQSVTRIGQLCIALSLLLMFRTIIRAMVHRNTIHAFLSQYRKGAKTIPPKEMSGYAINSALDGVDRLRLVDTQDSVRSYTARFNYYIDSPGSRYFGLGIQYCQLVIEASLVRRLPHIVFDSRASKDLEFKKLFLATQKLPIKPQFDKIFDTYVPLDYGIDALSFITPDIMELLLELKSYDIELIDHKLYVYAPLMDRRSHGELRDKVLYLCEKINRNIDTYHDERMAKRRQQNSTTSFARTLLPNPRPLIKKTIIWGAAVIFYIMIALNAEDPIEFLKWGYLLYFILAYYLLKTVYLIRANRRSIAAFYKKF